MVTYHARLDVPRHVVEYLARLLAAHHRCIGTPRGSRALGPFRQAVLVLRWFRERGCVQCLARDAGVSQATGYRYLNEGIDVLADRAPGLHDVLARCQQEGMSHLILDGTLITCDRVAGVTEDGTIYGTPARTRNPAGTSSSSPPPTALRCGSRRSSPERSMTSSPRACMPCQRCTRPLNRAAHARRLGLRRSRGRRAHCVQEAPREFA